jgi:hypothetical protein
MPSSNATPNRPAAEIVDHIFSACTWTADDRRAAQKEGWDLFDIDSTGVIEIQRLDTPRKFDSDDAARRYVRRMAANNSMLHMRALLCLANVIVGAELDLYRDQSWKDVASDITAFRERWDSEGTEIDAVAHPKAQLTMLRATCSVEPPSLRNAGTKIYSRTLHLVGTTTGRRRCCTLEGCRGERISVRWPDGRHTFPCSKGMELHAEGFKLV